MGRQRGTQMARLMFTNGGDRNREWWFCSVARAKIGGGRCKSRRFGWCAACEGTIPLRHTSTSIYDKRRLVGRDGADNVLLSAAKVETGRCVDNQSARDRGSMKQLLPQVYGKCALAFLGNITDKQIFPNLFTIFDAKKPIVQIWFFFLASLDARKDRPIPSFSNLLEIPIFKFYLYIKHCRFIKSDISVAIQISSLISYSFLTLTTTFSVCIVVGKRKWGFNICRRWENDLRAPNLPRLKENARTSFNTEQWVLSNPSKSYWERHWAWDIGDPNKRF